MFFEKVKKCHSFVLTGVSPWTIIYIVCSDEKSAILAQDIEKEAMV
jgi:hypothetical protein